MLSEPLITLMTRMNHDARSHLRHHEHQDDLRF
jgi:hypothetical protein